MRRLHVWPRASAACEDAGSRSAVMDQYSHGLLAAGDGRRRRGSSHPLALFAGRLVVLADESANLSQLGSGGAIPGRMDYGAAHVRTGGGSGGWNNPGI